MTQNSVQAVQADPGPGAAVQAPADSARLAGKTFQVLEFLLGKEHFAIDLFDVREVVEYTPITQLPNTPSYMKGIIDLRGEITTIIDLKDRLHIPVTETRKQEEGRFIVLDEKLTGVKTGILVDDVLAVSTFEKGDVDAASTAGAGDDDAILGIIKKRIKDKENEVSELVIWIDIRKTLSILEKRD
ncbi:chemotaxis protein CheW [Methanoregula sp.]|uniref:chemotaxis protein CheW n=1 Tax=Methanoregula sp. TaxID=2052170 RepID=UPI000CC1CD0B|nr:chemotaxis protein CheW [Methanoregula sp.]PKG32456.1 MAG: chemotaxis protein CheW [Methanoregula sp.]